MACLVFFFCCGYDSCSWWSCSWLKLLAQCDGVAITRNFFSCVYIYASFIDKALAAITAGSKKSNCSHMGLDPVVKTYVFSKNIRQDNFRSSSCKGGQFVQVVEYCSSLSVRSLTVFKTGTGNVVVTVLSNDSTEQLGQGHTFKSVSKLFDVLMAFLYVKVVLV